MINNNNVTLDIVDGIELLTIGMIHLLKAIYLDIWLNHESGIYTISETELGNVLISFLPSYDSNHFKIKLSKGSIK